MSTKVTVRNFQSVGNATFEIDGFTAIVGKNNIGKSALVRAINAALTNETGSGFIRRGTKETEVAIKGHGVDLKWKKGSTSSYTVNGESFSKLRGAVPEPIEKAGFRMVELGDLKLNPLLAEQFHEIFLLDKPGSKVTETLSAMYNLDVISKADDLCQKELKGVKSTLKTRDKDLAEVVGELEKYEGFEDLKKRVVDLAETQVKIETLKDAIEQLHDYEDQLSSLVASVKVLKRAKDIEVPNPSATQEEIVEYAWVTDRLNQLKDLQSSVSRLGKSQEATLPVADDVEDMIREVTELGGMLRNYEQLSSSVSRLESVATIQIPESGTVEKMIEECRVLIENESEFRSMIRETRESRDGLKELDQKIEGLEEEKSKIKVCPLCERPF